MCVFQLRPPTVIGQFHTLFFGSVRMFFLGVLGFAVYGNEALHFSCDPDRRELNLYCYNQFRPITPQVEAPPTDPEAFWNNLFSPPTSYSDLKTTPQFLHIARKCEICERRNMSYYYIYYYIIYLHCLAGNNVTSDEK